MLHPHHAGNPEWLVQFLQADAAVAAHMHYLVGRWWRNVDAGTEVGYQEKFLDLHVIGDPQRHYIAGQANMPTIHLRHHRSGWLLLQGGIALQLLAKLTQLAELMDRQGHFL